MDTFSHIVIPPPKWYGEHVLVFGSIAFAIAPNGKTFDVGLLCGHRPARSHAELRKIENAKKKVKRAKIKAGTYVPRGTKSVVSPLVQRAQKSAKRDAIARNSARKYSIYSSAA